MKRLNVGSGPNPPSDWYNIDVVDYGQAENDGWVGNLLHGLPYGDATFIYAVAHHSLQQVPYVALVPALQELRRVLDHGGVLRISVPDLRGALDAWLRNDPAWFPIIDEAEHHVGGKLCAYATWYSEARTVFTRGWLAELCVRAGFSQIAICYAGVTMLTDPATGITDLDSRPHESIYVEARA